MSRPPRVARARPGDQAPRRGARNLSQPVRGRLGAQQCVGHWHHRRPRTFEQWEHYLGALEYKFTSEDEALVDRLVAPGHPSTPGYNDPAYPLEGRVPRSG